jgi:hypothetical protein
LQSRVTNGRDVMLLGLGPTRIAPGATGQVSFTATDDLTSNAIPRPSASTEDATPAAEP